MIDSGSRDGRPDEAAGRCPLPPYVALAARHLRATGQWAGYAQAASDTHLRRTLAAVLAAEEELDCPPECIAFFERAEQALTEVAAGAGAHPAHAPGTGCAFLDPGAYSRHRAVLAELGLACQVVPAPADPSGPGSWWAHPPGSGPGPGPGLVVVTVPRTPGGSMPTREEWGALARRCGELGLALVVDETKGWPACETDCTVASLRAGRWLPARTWVLRDLPELYGVAPAVYLLRGHPAPGTGPPLPGDTRAWIALLLSTTRDHRDVARNRLRAARERSAHRAPAPPIG